MRTQQELIDRYNDYISNDVLFVQRSDLAEFMTLETARPFLNEEAVKKFDAGEDQWGEVATDSKSIIIDYLTFAYDQANARRPLASARSLLHFKTWIWFDDDQFYQEILPLIDDYDNFGLPALDKIAEHYGYEK